MYCLCYCTTRHPCRTFEYICQVHCRFLTLINAYFAEVPLLQSMRAQVGHSVLHELVVGLSYAFCTSLLRYRLFLFQLMPGTCTT